MNRTLRALMLLAVCLLLVARSSLPACPFCSAMTETLREQIDNMDAVVIARLTEADPVEADAAAPGGKTSLTGKFTLVKVLKGESLLQGATTVRTIFVGDPKQNIGAECMLLGVGPTKLMWSAPTFLSQRTREYLLKLTSLPADEPARLAFFETYLEDAEDMLARDAYEEFARAPYAVVKTLKGKIQPEKLVGWVKNANVPVSRKRLYLTMLGVCGSRADLPFLEELMRSEDRSVRSGLDALIACYLTLAGPEGMAKIEDLFLRNSKAEYADTYAAIMAIRFHGSESDAIPHARLRDGMRIVLDRPQLADLVIPDLARWEDWESLPRMVQLFKEANETNSWVRVPVVKYLQACPLPEAKTRLAELEKIDPEAVKRASTLFPFGGGGPATRAQKN